MDDKKTIHTKIVGVTKRNEDGLAIQKILKELDGSVYEGQLLILEHEDDNEYDPNAIKVYLHGEHIGYIKKELAAEIVEAVDEDRIEAELCEITGGEDLSYGCNICLTLLDEADPPHASPFPKPTSTPSEDKPSLTDPKIRKLRGNVLISPLLIGLSVLMGLIGIILLVVAHEIPLGLICIVVAALECLWSLRCSEAGDELEQLGAGELALQAKKSGIRLSVTLLTVIVLIAGSFFFVRRQIEEKLLAEEAAAWDRHAIATATVALDQYAPGVDYGPITTEGWTVIHNNDGTTTVWAPLAYGRISVMFTDDGENYTPYYIAVDGVVKLDSK